MGLVGFATGVFSVWGEGFVEGGVEEIAGI
jgi:hypothetical protein